MWNAETWPEFLSWFHVETWIYLFNITFLLRYWYLQEFLILLESLWSQSEFSGTKILVLERGKSHTRPDPQDCLIVFIDCFKWVHNHRLMKWSAIVVQNLRFVCPQFRPNTTDPFTQTPQNTSHNTLCWPVVPHYEPQHEYRQKKRIPGIFFTVYVLHIGLL